jgi:hypothetical protein
MASMRGPSSQLGLRPRQGVRHAAHPPLAHDLAEVQHRFFDGVRPAGGQAESRWAEMCHSLRASAAPASNPAGGRSFGLRRTGWSTRSGSGGRRESRGTRTTARYYSCLRRGGKHGTEAAALLALSFPFRQVCPAKCRCQARDEHKCTAGYSGDGSSRQGA